MLPDDAPLFVTPALYAEPPDDSRIWNGCEPPELLMKRYFNPLIK